VHANATRQNTTAPFVPSLIGAVLVGCPSVGQRCVTTVKAKRQACMVPPRWGHAPTQKTTALHPPGHDRDPCPVMIFTLVRPISDNVQSCRRDSRQRVMLVEVSEANEAGNCLLSAVPAHPCRSTSSPGLHPPSTPGSRRVPSGVSVVLSKCRRYPSGSLSIVTHMPLPTSGIVAGIPRSVSSR